MQLAQAAKEKMHTPVFSLAASAAIAATTKSAGTNPIPQPDAGPGRHVFFKTNPISGLARNSCLGHQLPTAILYQGLGLAISNTATRFAHPLYDFRVRPRCTGKERDAETGLDFFGARYTSAPEGRFSSPDPSPAGIAIQDPQSWNLYAYVRDRPTRFVDGNGNWATDIHAEIVTYALQGYVSAGELNELRKMQYVMDADQSDQNTHSMANRNQSSQDALTGTWRFVSAQMAMIPGNIGLGGTLTTAGLDELGSALHTVQDYTSPMHTDSNFNPMEWRGGYWPPWKLGPGAAHVLGESNPASDWSRIGLAVRLTMAAFLQSGAACESGRRCLTEANFETEFRRNVEDYVSHHYAFLPSVGGSPAIEDAARQCALGNPAACFR